MKDRQFWLVSRESENPLKYRIHRELSEQIRLACEQRLGIRIDPYWFSLGNVYPDCTHHRVLHHEIDAVGRHGGADDPPFLPLGYRLRGRNFPLAFAAAGHHRALFM